MRLFFALWPPAELAERLAAEAGALARRFRGKATRQETIHVTLAFLGDVEESRLPEVMTAARQVLAAPFDLTVDNLGYWRHNRLLWAGCSAVPPPLEALVGSLRERLREALIVCDDTQRFVPHLTLVRKVSGAPHARDLPGIEPLSWPCRGFALVRSALSDRGSDYATLAEFPFTSVAAVAAPPAEGGLRGGGR